MSENKNRRFSIYLPILLASMLIIGILLGIVINKKPQLSYGGIMLYPKTNKLNNVIKYIQEEYVDTISTDKISEEAIISLLKGLDPHSVYIPARDLQAVNEPLEGNFSGIGVQFNIQNDTVIIITTILNGPSALVGLMAGDRIVKVNDTVIAGKKLDSEAIVKKLKGPRGTKVKVAIKRPGSRRELIYEITRDKIPLNSIDVAYMLDSTIGYIKISQFARTTIDEFAIAASRLHERGMKKIILDLRGNGGGYLEAAINLADQFLEKGKLIVYTLGRAKPRDDFQASDNGTCHYDKLVILIDEYSASASEILAGAVQDNDRGQIVGRRSFGKGLVQEQRVFADGSAIRLTVARYYTPSGRCIQKSYKNGSDDYFKDLSYRFLHGELEYKDSIRFNDSLKFKTAGGRTVYGGGGIMPDVFVPFDTSGISKFFIEVRDLGLIYKFSFNYSDANRIKLKKINSLKEFRAFLKKDKVFDKFLNYAIGQGAKPERKDLQVSKALISTQLEAYIARYFFDNEGFYPIIKEVDNTLNRAVTEISK